MILYHFALLGVSQKNTKKYIKIVRNVKSFVLVLCGAVYLLIAALSWFSIIDFFFI